ncbi:hypothetical protein CPAR01_02544 [Colletotrichum paranaense]|uniref:Extracellular serine-threonine rich protein n=8 Tax=Colletotrichum acutatum species complex TaxID=2707335 RepID=A0A9P7UE73_9PEZI|nr:uncharacterized protein HER10_EVM0012327 [Colletotrichum scovillei]XP_060318299.1 uncharacterized protein CCOS01_03851 [Colletotrichum costaricense]XP_060354159.1 uncharacterized protein CPAR01_02544 [Colletotrichum paranaense]XP_060380943.1 uncharacterized protein CTAM01_08410 [Colletotrichum tamarilloi]XP_060405249.1 uncharacterized protein CABS01_05619 [Colletotrichum abscissum]KAI3540250.1 hypothetical protein CSPX01_08439 [Colletotrichum filicis]KAK0380769.1 hypothetical protein CLIM0
MKSSIAAVGLMASLASASAYQPRHFHWRRDNTTAPAGYTTLTVEVTEVATVTSCAPTITNCPARSATLSASDLSTYVVTNTVVLTEVVCPVTEAASLSKSLVQQHSTGGLQGSTRTAPVITTPTAAPSIPLSTAGVTNSAQDPTVTSPPTAGGDDEEEDDDCPAEDGDVVTTVTQIISTKTLTMTVGKGSTASVVTTAIPTTIESTIVVTKPTGSATGAGEEPTTTTTATSTGTRTVTIKRPGQTAESASPSGTLGADGQCACPSAVTVTIPASTVYVTIGGSAPAATPSASASKTASAEAPVTTGDVGADGEDDEEDDCPADEDVVTLSTTVTVAPYPTNGTASGAAKPTGYYKRSNKLF